MKAPHLTASIIACTLALLSAAQAKEKEPLSARIFAGADGRLTQGQAAFYIVYRDQEPLAKLLPPGQTQLVQNHVVDAMADKLDDLRSKTGHEAPWSWQELDKAYPPKKPKKEQDAELPAWKKLEGITKAKPLGEEGKDGSLGPIRIRKSTDDLTKSLGEAKGATLGYSENRLTQGSGAWNTEGVLNYPITLFGHGRGGRSAEAEFGPAVSWKLSQVQGDKKKNVEELGFSIPTTFFLSPGSRTSQREDTAILASSNEVFSALWVVQAKPYAQTDFVLEHLIYGAQASVEFVGGVFHSPLYLGSFQNLGSSSLQYQIRVIPKLDYSSTQRGGIYTTRKKGDDWLRIGGLASFDLRLGSATFNPLDLGVSYEFLETLSGSGGYSKLFKAHATWWLAENIGMQIEYNRGDTPVSDKKTDLLTLGLEFKY